MSRRPGSPASYDGRMSLAEHIAELRRRLVISFVAIAVAIVAAFVWYPPIFDWLTHPYCSLEAAHRLGGRNCDLAVTGIFDALTVRLRVAAIVGVVGASPFWVYQLWAFVAPALHRNEKRWAVAFAAASGALFAGGAVFAYYALGRSLAFLLGFAHGLTVLITIDRYLSFVSGMVLVFGVSFEFPLLVLLLNLAGVVSARRLAGAWRITIFGIFVFAALATPSQDPLTMSLMAGPMCLLYGVALLLAYLNDRRRARREVEHPYALLDDDATSPLDLPDTSEPAPQRDADTGVDAVR